MRAPLILQVIALCIGSMEAQSVGCGCRPMCMPSTYPIYSTPHLTSLVPYFHSPNILQQNIVSPSYQNPPILVPIPPPPKDCTSAKTTVKQQAVSLQHGNLPGINIGPGHPPVVVQSVYVGKKEDEDEDKKTKKKSCKKKGSEEVEDDQREERCYKLKRRRRIQRRQRRLPLFFEPVDPSSLLGPSFDEPLRCLGCNTRNSRMLYTLTDE